MVMQNPSLTIENLLSANWNNANVSTRMANENLEFMNIPYSFNLPKTGRRPVPDDKNASIQISRISATSEPLGNANGTSLVRDSYQIDVFVKPASSEEGDLDNARKDIFEVEREISRIIRANRNSMTDLKWGFPKRFLRQDEIDRVPPLLRSFTEVEVFYFET